MTAKLLARIDPTWALVAWTFVVWGSRLRNIIDDAELDGTERISALAVATVFLALGVGVAAATVLRPARRKPLVIALAIVGIVRWSIRGPIILVEDDWSAAFKLVHTVLWVVTVGLGLWAWRSVRTGGTGSPGR